MKKNKRSMMNAKDVNLHNKSDALIGEVIKSNKFENMLAAF